MPPLELAGVPAATPPHLKRERLVRYAGVCSEVMPNFLYVSGREPAESLETLQEHGITHVVNCAAAAVPSLFDLKYLDLAMNDDVFEDVAWFVYETLDFVDKCWDDGGRVLVHCARGVSRSCALAIACVMVRTMASYADAYAAVRLCRPICDPNSGFASQLTAWHTRRLKLTSNFAVSFAFRAAYRHDTCVAKLCCEGAPLETLLDPRTAFVLIHDGASFVWHGWRADDRLKECAARCAAWLAAYDAAPPCQFQDHLGEASDEFRARFGVVPIDLPENPAYDADFVGRDESSAANPDLQAAQPPPPSSLASCSSDTTSPTVDATPRLDEKRTRLFEHDGAAWNLVADYDHNDLDPSSLMLLAVENRSAADDDQIYLWVGADAPLLLAAQTTSSRADAVSEFARAAAAFLDRRDDDENTVEVVWGGRETPAFWAAFESGF